MGDLDLDFDRGGDGDLKNDKEKVNDPPVQKRPHFNKKNGKKTRKSQEKHCTQLGSACDEKFIILSSLVFIFIVMD